MSLLGDDTWLRGKKKFSEIEDLITEISTTDQREKKDGKKQNTMLMNYGPTTKCVTCT